MLRHERSLDPPDELSEPRDERVSSIELRIHPRAMLAASVTLVSSSHLFPGRATDLSVGGVFVTTYAALPLESVVEVELDLPDGALSVVGVVRRVCEGAGRAPGLGIEFELLFDEERARIERFCGAGARMRFDIDDPAEFTE